MLMERVRVTPAKKPDVLLHASARRTARRNNIV